MMETALLGLPVLREKESARSTRQPLTRALERHSCREDRDKYVVRESIPFTITGEFDKGRLRNRFTADNGSV